MKVISSREFRDNQKMYFDLADKNEQIIIQRGKNKSYLITPVTDNDTISVNQELMEKIEKAEINISKGNITRIKDANDIWKSIL